MPMAPAAGPTGAPSPVRWLRRVVLVVLALAIAYVVVEQVGRIDWDAVREALGHLSWWQPFVLLAVLAVRQVLNGLPLHFYIEGLSVARATQNDLGAILMANIAPSPADYALRTAMFVSWGIPAARGVAGALMNTLTFYMARFSAPLVGFVLLVAVEGDPGYRWGDLLSLAVATAIVVGVMLVLRSDPLARTVGSRSARVVGRLRKGVDPERWAQSCVDFRGHISGRFRYGFPRSLAGMVGMVLTELVLLLMCLRFVGVSGSDVGLTDVAIAFLFAYPLTILPFTGIGIVDALVVAALVETGGGAVEAPGVAALIVWRVFTLGIPIIAGVGAIALWRGASRVRPRPQQPARPPGR